MVQVSYREYVRLERKTLTLLHAWGTQFPFLQASGGSIGAAVKAKWPSGFAVNLVWETAYKDEACRIFVGGLIEKSKKGDTVERSSHYLLIARGTGKEVCILRKYHFDYDPGTDKDAKQAHPYYHIQYAGDYVPGLAEWGITDEHMAPLDPNTSEPRLFYFPVSLAIIMNIGFHEFPTDETLKFVKKNEWRGVILDNEEKLLLPYHQNCVSIVSVKRKPLFEWLYPQVK